MSHLAKTITPVTTGLDLYCPHKPWPKQQEILDIDFRAGGTDEAFYGGAVGGGKSDLLLMAALQYVHVPGYSALILRRTMTRLQQPGAILDRAVEWLYHTDAKYNAQKHIFRFPSGAKLKFSFIDSPEDRYQFNSTEYQFIGFDELSEFRLPDGESNPYLYMFSRLRKVVGIDVPIRMFAASNPGGVSHDWLKRRFITERAKNALLNESAKGIYWTDHPKPIAFVPALIKDNPAINEEEYLEKLSHLPPVTRARLVKGDWSIREDSLIDSAWIQDYTMRGSMLQPLNQNGENIGTGIDARSCTNFATIDTAGTSALKAAEKKGSNPSWSVMAVWSYAPSHGHMLFLRHVWRERVDYPGLKAGVRKCHAVWQPTTTYIENAHFGPALASELRSEIQVRMVPTHVKSQQGQSGRPGKVERASKLFKILEEGRFFLPLHDNDWKPEYVSELISWTGLDSDTDDQVDVSSHAANIVSTGAGMVVKASSNFLTPFKGYPRQSTR